MYFTAINNDWKYVSSESFDLKSLVRNVCLYKLTKVLKLNTLCILSKSGEFIYVLISADEELLKDQAEKSEYQLQLDVAETDAFSLEPCDDKWRPLRLSKSPNKPERLFEKEKQIEFFYMHIYKKELDYLNNLFPTEHQTVKDITWKAYEYYLDFLIENKHQILKILQSNEELNGIFTRGIFDLAFEYSFKKSQIKLNSLWNFFQQENTGAYSSYIRKDDFGTTDEAYCKFIFIKIYYFSMFNKKKFIGEDISLIIEKNQLFSKELIT